MLPQLDPTWYASQSFWLLITFCAMFLIVWRFIMPLMRATVDARQTRLESDIKATEELKARAEALLKEYEASMSDVKKQSQEMLAKAQEEVSAALKQTETDFNSRLSAHLSAGEQKLEEAKTEAMRSVRQIASELTVKMTEKVASIALSPDEITRHINAVMEENGK